MTTTRRRIDDLADKLADCMETLRDPVTGTEFERCAFVVTEVNGVLEVRARRYPEGSPVMVVAEENGIAVHCTRITKCQNVELAVEFIRRILAM